MVRITAVGQPGVVGENSHADGTDTRDDDDEPLAPSGKATRAHLVGVAVLPADLERVNLGGGLAIGPGSGSRGRRIVLDVVDAPAIVGALAPQGRDGLDAEPAELGGRRADGLEAGLLDELLVDIWAGDGVGVTLDAVGRGGRLAVRVLRVGTGLLALLFVDFGHC